MDSAMLWNTGSLGGPTGKQARWSGAGPVLRQSWLARSARMCRAARAELRAGPAPLMGGKIARRIGQCGGPPSKTRTRARAKATLRGFRLVRNCARGLACAMGRNSTRLEHGNPRRNTRRPCGVGRPPRSPQCSERPPGAPNRPDWRRKRTSYVTGARKTETDGARLRSVDRLRRKPFRSPQRRRGRAGRMQSARRRGVAY